MACQSRRSLGLDIFIHEMYLIQTTKVNSKLCNYVNPSVSKAGNCSWKSKSRIASYISQRKPIWNTSRKILSFGHYKCYLKNKEDKKIKEKARSRYYWSKPNCRRLTEICIHVVILDQKLSIFAYTHITSIKKQFLLVYRSESDFEYLQMGN